MAKEFYHFRKPLCKCCLFMLLSVSSLCSLVSVLLHKDHSPEKVEKGRHVSALQWPWLTVLYRNDEIQPVQIQAHAGKLAPANTEPWSRLAEGNPHPPGSLTDLPCERTARQYGSPGHVEKPDTGLLADTIAKVPAGSSRNSHTCEWGRHPGDSSLSHQLLQSQERPWARQLSWAQSPETEAITRMTWLLSVKSLSCEVIHHMAKNYWNNLLG